MVRLMAKLRYELDGFVDLIGSCFCCLFVCFLSISLSIREAYKQYLCLLISVFLFLCGQELMNHRWIYL